MKFLILLALGVAVGSAAHIGQQSQITIPPHVLALIEQTLAKPEVQAAIQASNGYKCLNANIPGGFTYEFVKQLYREGKLNYEYLSQHPVIQHCVSQQGGITDLLTNSVLLRQLKALIVQHGLEAEARAAILSVLGPELGGRLLALIASLPRENISRGIVIPPHIIALIEQTLAKPEVQAAIQASNGFKCLNANVPGGFTYEFVKQLYREGKLNYEYLSQHPVIQYCVSQQGGISDLLTNSVLLRQLKALIVQQGLEAEARAAILSVLGPELGGRLLALIASLPRESISRGIVIPPHIIALIEQTLAKPEVQAAIQASNGFKCLNTNLPGGFTYEFVKQLYREGKLNYEYLSQQPVIQYCVSQQGGLTDLITNSVLVRQFRALIVQHGLEAEAKQAILTVLGPELGGKLLALIASLPDARVAYY